MATKSQAVVLLPLRHDPRQSKVTMLAGMRLEGDDIGVVRETIIADGMLDLMK